MKMERRHFQFIADVIKAIDTGHGLSPSDIALTFASALATTNPNFKRQRFLDACERSEHSLANDKGENQCDH